MSPVCFLRQGLSLSLTYIMTCLGRFHPFKIDNNGHFVLAVLISLASKPTRVEVTGSGGALDGPAPTWTPPALWRCYGRLVEEISII